MKINKMKSRKSAAKEIFYLILPVILNGFSIKSNAASVVVSTKPTITLTNVTMAPALLKVIDVLQHSYEVNATNGEYVEGGIAPDEVQIIKDDSLKTSARYDLKLKNGVLVHTLYLSKEASQSPELAIPELALLTKTAGHLPQGYSSGDKLSLKNPFAFFELFLNSEQGSKLAELEIMRSKRALLSKVDSVFLDFNLPMHIKNLDSEIALLELEAKKQLTQKEENFESKRASSTVLEDYEAMNNKLNDLVIANDRKGVRKMLEAYIPWDLMEPVEISSWKAWLDAIENPRPQEAIFMVRGLDYSTDKIQKGQHGEIGLFSTVLTKNQGSYTRRLRSLVTNRLKNGAEPDLNTPYLLDGSKGATEKDTNRIHATLLSNQFNRHSLKPEASSFISFTPLINIANSFAKAPARLVDANGTETIKPKGGMIVVKVDPRRMFFNYSTEYAHEIEFLAPLIIFPDEVVIYDEKTDHNLRGPDYEKRLIKLLSENPSIKIVNHPNRNIEIVTLEEVNGAWTQKKSINELKMKFIEEVLLKNQELKTCNKIF